MRMINSGESAIAPARKGSLPKILLSAGEGESGPEQKMLRTVIEFRWSADVGQVMFYALCR